MRTFTDVPLDNKFAYIYQQGGHPIRLPEQAISGKDMAFVEPDDAWKARMRLEAWGPGYSGPEKYASDESEIMRRLLDFGGYAVVMAWHESDAEAILERGQLWYRDRTGRNWRWQPATLCPKMAFGGSIAGACFVLQHGSRSWKPQCRELPTTAL